MFPPKPLLPSLLQHQRQLAKSRSASPVAGRAAKRIKREPKWKAEAASEAEQSDGDSDYGMSAEVWLTIFSWCVRPTEGIALLHKGNMHHMVS